MRAFITFQFIIISLNQVQKYINMGWWHIQRIIATCLHWQTQRLNSAKGYLSEIFCPHKILWSRCGIKYSFLCYSFKMHSFRRNIYDFIILILCLTLYNLKTSNAFFQDFAPFALHDSWKAYNSPYIKCNCRGLEKIPIMCTFVGHDRHVVLKTFRLQTLYGRDHALKTRPGEDQIRW